MRIGIDMKTGRYNRVYYEDGDLLVNKGTGWEGIFVNIVKYSSPHEYRLLDAENASSLIYVRGPWLFKTMYTISKESTCFYK